MLVHRFGGNDGSDDARNAEDKKHRDDHAFVQTARSRQNRVEVRIGRKLPEYRHHRQEIELLQTRALQDHRQTLQRPCVCGFTNRQHEENRHEHQGRADADNEKRRTIANYYIDNIKNYKIILPLSYTSESHVWHVFPVRVPNREQFQSYLAKNGIETLIHYPTAPHHQGCFKEWHHLSLPITEKIHREIISLPVSPVMTKDEIDKVIELVNDYD